MSTLALDRPPSARRITPAPPDPASDRHGAVPETFREVVFRLGCLFAAAVPLLNVVMLPGIGTLSRATGLLFALAGLGVLLVQGRRRAWQDAHLVALFLLGWTALSQVWSTTPLATSDTIQTAAQLVAMYLLVWEFAPERRHVDGMFRAYVGGATIAAIALLVTAANEGGDLSRYTVGEAHPNDLGFVIALAIPMAWSLATRTHRPVVATLYRTFPVLALLATSFTGSRSSLLLCGVALSIVPTTFGRLTVRARLATLLVLLVAGGAALQAAPDRPVERLGTIADEADGGDFSGRTGLWSDTLRIIARDPVYGVGAGGARFALLDEGGAEKGVHNTYLSVAAELGVVGLLAWLLLLAMSFLPGVRGAGSEALLVRVLAATLVLGLVPRHWEYDKATWLVLALAVGLADAARRERAAAAVAGRLR